ncbi:MAG: hypothetical protein ACD_71C00105G0002 [uncultured bacterium (gcode 4)]|uniref:Uncharacterized protein n=1 Tax=uncultured bacterium (gcode 4) TaxID=1234023 RepID=K1Z4U1_9BACT|nr:MAG: hypothetical protein ACD_71C00105G0002 [uncultured bacterium (gcode 4)]
MKKFSLLFLLFYIIIIVSWCQKSETPENIKKNFEPSNSIKTETGKDEAVIILAKPAPSDASPPPPIINSPIGPRISTQEERNKVLAP